MTFTSCWLFRNVCLSHSRTMAWNKMRFCMKSRAWDLISFYCAHISIASQFVMVWHREQQKTENDNPLLVMFTDWSTGISYWCAFNFWNAFVPRIRFHSFNHCCHLVVVSFDATFGAANTQLQFIFVCLSDEWNSNQMWESKSQVRPSDFAIVKHTI